MLRSEAARLRPAGHGRSRCAVQISTCGFPAVGSSGYVTPVTLVSCVTNGHAAVLSGVKNGKGRSARGGEGGDRIH